MQNDPKPFPKGDIRRLLALALVIDKDGPMSLSDITTNTGHNKGTVDADIVKLNDQLGVTIHKNDSRPAMYNLESWGVLLQRENVEKFLQKALV